MLEKCPENWKDGDLLSINWLDMSFQVVSEQRPERELEQQESGQLLERGFEEFKNRRWLTNLEFDRAFELAAKPVYSEKTCNNCKSDRKTIYDTGLCGMCVGWTLENLWGAY